jgi:N utilization substance protein B
MANKKFIEQRKAERAYALQVMYQGDILDVDPVLLVKQGRLASDTQLLGDYAKKLLAGATEHLGAVDERIEKASENWSLDRMPAVDRSLLRLAAYEMVYVNDVPVSVSINEAVNLAKRFGGDDSPRFVNGILGRIATQIEEGQEFPEGPTADEALVSDETATAAETSTNEEAPVEAFTNEAEAE